MLIRQAFRFRLRPNAEQQHKLAIQFGHARHVYNWALARKQEHYKATGATLSRYDLQAELVTLKADPDHAWLKDADSQVLQVKLRDLDRAYTNFFAPRPFSDMEAQERRAKHPVPPTQTLSF